MKKIHKIILIIITSVVIVLGGVFGTLYYVGLSGFQANGNPKEGQIKIACVGDSITYGFGIKNWKKNNYPAKLQKELGNAYHVNNYGVSGCCVQNDANKPYTSLKEYQQSLDYNPDIVVFMMGSNDSKPFNWKSPGAFRSDLEELLLTYEKENRKIYLCTPATAFYLEEKQGSETSFEIQPGVVEIISEIVKGIANQHGYTLIDINTFTEDKGIWFEDGVHPNNEGAKEIAKIIASNIK